MAAKTALSTAGAATAIVGSPTPPQKPPEGITIDSTAGMSAIRRAYAHAMANEYRFFSYGDAMLIERAQMQSDRLTGL